MVGTGDWVLAVDLGTTKTRAAYTAPGSREPVEVRIPPDNATWLASCVARDPDSGGWLVGKDAERLRTGWTGAFVQNAKRLLGQAEPHYFDGHPFSILEIVAQPLIHAAMIARAQAGHVFDRLALAAPVQFEEYRRELLLQAAELAGFPPSCVSIATEAEAAARTALGSSPADGTWLLFDMGGGTLDVALLRTRAGELRVLDAFGTDEVSGYVLDTAVMEHLRTAYASELAAGGSTGKDGRDQDAEQWREALLRDTAELAKTGVTTRGPGRATLADPQLRVVLSPEALRKLAAPAMDLALEKCEALLNQNGLQRQELKAVVCSGGSTRGPVIRELLSAPGTPVHDAAGTPELAVVHGLLASGARSRLFHPKTIRPANSSGVHVLRALAHTKQVTAVTFSPSGAYLATASGASVDVWSPADGTHLWTFAEHTEVVRALAFGPGDLLASSSDDQTVRLRSLGRDDTSRVLQAQAEAGVWAVAFSPDGSLLACGGRDNLVRLLAVNSGDQVLEPLSGHEAVVIQAGFAPDGSVLATAADHVVRIWDPADGTVRAVLNGHSSDVAALAFSPDSTRLATASHDGTVRIWEPDQGTCRQVFTQHTDYVRGVAFSPTGEFVASGDDDSVVRLWDPETGRELFTLTGHQGYVRSVAFSPDGTLLASGDDAQVRIWGLG